MPAPALPGPAAALWDKLGGETRVEKVVDAWIAASQADVKIDLTAGGAHKLDAEALTRAKRRLIGHISNLSDGTVPYIGKSLADAHAGFPVAGEPLIQFLSHLRTAMIGQGIAPGDVDELMARVEKAK
jgi:truncated hemoglobin YjbI